MNQTTDHGPALDRRSHGVSVPGAPMRATLSMRALSPTAVRCGLDSTPPPHAVEAAPFNTVIVGLTRGLFAVIDAADLHLIAGYQWRVNASGSSKMYAVAGQSPKIIMHRLILGVTNGLFVDHINGDTLDNRRCNLRPATASQNRANAGKSKSSASSKYRGVSWKKRDRRWQAQIFHKGACHFLGYFLTEEEAARAYDAAFLNIHGEFARLNFQEAA